MGTEETVGDEGKEMMEDEGCRGCGREGSRNSGKW